MDLCVGAALSTTIETVFIQRFLCTRHFLLLLSDEHTFHSASHSLSILNIYSNVTLTTCNTWKLATSIFQQKISKGYDFILCAEKSRRKFFSAMTNLNESKSECIEEKLKSNLNILLVVTKNCQNRIEFSNFVINMLIVRRNGSDGILIRYFSQSSLIFSLLVKRR